MAGKEGGKIVKTGEVTVHEGEFIIPKSGALVKTDGNSRMDINVTYNIGTVYGVDNLEKLLEKHDRVLYKKLMGLV